MFKHLQTKLCVKFLAVSEMMWTKQNTFHQKAFVCFHMLFLCDNFTMFWSRSGLFWSSGFSNLIFPLKGLTFINSTPDTFVWIELYLCFYENKNFHMWIIWHCCKANRENIGEERNQPVFIKRTISHESV